MADQEAEWICEIKKCGEPPAVARVVELVSQWEFFNGDGWIDYLSQTEDPELRSQWQRAWLAGPVGNAKFEQHEEQFEKATFADDFRFLKKVLVWFQAEKTSPNTGILAGKLPVEQRQRIADYLGWPSDFSAWRRLINFVVRRISSIPQKLYPDVVAIFEVWQNGLSELSNPTSRAILNLCASWLERIDIATASKQPDENTTFWQEVPNQVEFRKSLEQMLLRSSKSEPELTQSYLRRTIKLKRITEDRFRDIVSFSPLVAQTSPKLLVDLTLKFLKEELPQDRVARLERESLKREEMRQELLAKPESERSDLDLRVLDDFSFPMSLSSFNDHDWDGLSLRKDYRSFNPPSPLREPFHSLFSYMPKEALRLLKSLCNHAMTSWRQLHQFSHNSEGNPLPLKIAFPWGEQIFWGTDREYLWFRSMWAPDAIGCGFMALEEWCFSELERGRNVDELMKEILEGNECIAALGIASMITIHTEVVSEVTLSLVSSQRLLAADFNRMRQDLSSSANLMGFMNRADMPHVDAIRAANNRMVRKKELRWMVPRFVFSGESISQRISEVILNFKHNLPYQYEEHRKISGATEHLTAQANKYAELVDEKNYQTYRAEENSDDIAIVHVSPSASTPENVAKAKEASTYLRQSNLWNWASECLKDKVLREGFTVDGAIKFAKEIDSHTLFENSDDFIGDEDQRLEIGTRRGAVASAAAIALTFRDGVGDSDLDWGRSILSRAISLKEKRGPMWAEQSLIPWHHLIFVVKAIGSEIRYGTATESATIDLICLVTYPLEIVSLSVIEEAVKLWSDDPKLVWVILWLAFSLCHIPRRQKYDEPLDDSTDDFALTIHKAIEFYTQSEQWPPLPLPPPAWVRVSKEKENRFHFHEDYEWNDIEDTSVNWGEPDVFWNSKKASEIISKIPFEEVLNSEAKGLLIDFFASVLVWTNEKNSPPWVKRGRRNQSPTRIIEWTHALGSRLGHVAGLIPFDEFQPILFDPVMRLEDENCWALLSPFTSTYICGYVYDATVIPEDAKQILDLCLNRFLEAPVFKRDSYRGGKFSGFDQPRLVETLMFVSIERAELAARFVNGDWSDIGFIIPLVDKFVRAGGWAASVMDPYLTLCERSKEYYPAEVFANQIISIIHGGSDNLKGWHGTFIPARIAELVQFFAHRDTPLNLALAKKFLRILDILVDMGDRRSAALQLGESFREVRLPS